MQHRLEKLNAALQNANLIEKTFRERGVLLDGGASEDVNASGAWNVVGRIRPFDIGTERVELRLELEIGNTQREEGSLADGVVLALSITDYSPQAAAKCSIDIELFLSSDETELYISWDGLKSLGLVRESFSKNELKFSDYQDPSKTHLNHQDLESALRAIADIVLGGRLLVR